MARTITDTTKLLTLTNQERSILDRALRTLDTAAINRMHAILGRGRSTLIDEAPDEDPAQTDYDPLLSAAFFAAVAVARRVRRHLNRNIWDEDITIELALIPGEAAVLAQALCLALADPRQHAEDAQTLAYYEGDPESQRMAQAELDAERRCARSLGQRLADL